MTVRMPSLLSSTILPNAIMCLARAYFVISGMLWWGRLRLRLLLLVVRGRLFSTQNVVNDGSYMKLPPLDCKCLLWLPVRVDMIAISSTSSQNLVYLSLFHMTYKDLTRWWRFGLCILYFSNVNGRNRDRGWKENGRLGSHTSIGLLTFSGRLSKS